MQSTTNDEHPSTTPAWEKILGVFGLLLIGSGFIYLVWVAVNENDSPPDITFSVTEINPVDAGFLVQVEVANKGSQSVAVLTLESTLTLESGESESSSIQLDYLPSRSKSIAGFYFTQDPRKGSLFFKPSGYQEP
jgi:uncharacterized protein (TIGR02588 family)